ncbi:MAG: ABC transporter ATP-binding protein [Epulopiscium sp.]|nr:ABC transporter ATP-binding protein [Candidatus Epulonipiscium sp.]
MLKIKNINKSFGSNLVLEDINIRVEENKIYGLLGRNGVGKTTLLNLISNQIFSDSGSIKLDGEEVVENPKALEDICLVKGFPQLMKVKRVNELFTLASLMYVNWDEDYKDRLVGEFKLDTRKKLNNLSTGQTTVVGLIIGLASRARLTMFDEPTLGLDSVSRYKFYELLLEDYELNPRTIIISTHLIDEVANLFEEVIILKDKKVLLQEEVDVLKERSYILSASDQAISPFVKGKQIIYKEKLGERSIVGIYGDITDKERSDIKSSNIEISNISLEKLFVYLSENTIKEVI